MTNIKNITDSVAIASGVGGSIVTAQLGEILGIVLTCLCILSTTISVVCRIIDKVKEAKEGDGKIDIDEAIQIGQAVKDGVDEIKQEVEKHGKETNRNGK